jgi:hypothetical protein
MTTCCDQNAPPGGCRQGQACPVRLGKPDTVDLGGGNVYFPSVADKLGGHPGSAEDVALCWLGRLLVVAWAVALLALLVLAVAGTGWASGWLYDQFGETLWAWLASAS